MPKSETPIEPVHVLEPKEARMNNRNDAFTRNPNQTTKEARMNNRNAFTRNPKHTTKEARMNHRNNAFTPNANETTKEASTMNNESMIAHPTVVEALTRTLSARGIVAQNLEDAIADVQLKVLLHARKHGLPAGLGQLTRLCNKIASNHAASLHRQKYRRSKVEVSLCEDPDSYFDERAEASFDPVDHDRLIDIMKATLEASSAPKLSFMILEGEANGASLAEIAAEVGLTIPSVRSRLIRMRKAFRARLAREGLTDLVPRLKIHRGDS